MRRLAALAVFAAGALWAAEEHGGGQADSSIYWKWVNFAILGGALGYGIAKAAPAFFRGRSEAIREALEDAEEIRRKAEARAGEIGKRLANLNAELEAIRAEALRDIAAEAERARQETERLVARVHEHAEQELVAAARQAGKELRAHSADVALELAAQKIRSRLTPEGHQDLVETMIDNLPGPGAPVNR